MKVSKQRLLDFIDSEIARLHEEHTARMVAMCEQAIAKETEWQRDFGPKWDAVLATCTDARSRGEIITYAMLRPIMDGYYNKVRTFEIADVIDFTLPDELVGLRELVHTVVDDLIDLKLLSGKGRDINAFFAKYGNSKPKITPKT